MHSTWKRSVRQATSPSLPSPARRMRRAQILRHRAPGTFQLSVGSCCAAQVVLQAFPDAPCVFSSLEDDEEAESGGSNGSIPRQSRQRWKAHRLLERDVADVIELHCHCLFRESIIHYRDKGLSYPCVTRGSISGQDKKPDRNETYGGPLLWATAAYWREVVAGTETAQEHSDTLHNFAHPLFLCTLTPCMVREHEQQGSTFLAQGVCCL